jgi:thiol-disulfide isomerase/thioredoxin
MGAPLTLYGRTYCHLCDDMATALEGLRESLGFDFRIVDVDADPAIEARYGDLVPVLVDPLGSEICHYFLDIAALRSRLAVK